MNYLESCTYACVENKTDEIDDWTTNYKNQEDDANKHDKVVMKVKIILASVYNNLLLILLIEQELLFNIRFLWIIHHSSV